MNHHKYFATTTCYIHHVGKTDHCKYLPAPTKSLIIGDEIMRVSMTADAKEKITRKHQLTCGYKIPRLEAPKKSRVVEPLHYCVLQHHFLLQDLV